MLLSINYGRYSINKPHLVILILQSKALRALINENRLQFDYERDSEKLSMQAHYI